MWASQVKGKCSQCNTDIYNNQDTISLVDEDTGKAIVTFHSNAICWRKWREENLK